MEVLREDLMEQEIGTSPESFQKFLDSQRELFHSQIDQLQSIVVTQCKLTGVNPLAQEMAAGALSIKIGKRPRDLLNPKAVKYMQSIFSIKDAITKKDSREIGALFGVTVTQVRDFFNSQRSRVRKFVRLSREKALRLKASRDSDHDFTTDAASVTPVDPVPLNSIAPNRVGEAPSSPTSNDLLPGINEAEKEFVDKIFMLMGKEEAFSGQVKLMEWVLRVENSSVLSWFMTHGGIMILATWLSQAAIEEQTSVLFIILEVLSHLPLYKALPSQLSAVLQTVNRLRFYRTSDVSNRAKALLSKWSKMFARNQTMKKANGTNSSNSLQKGRMVKQSFGMGEEAWQSDNSIPEEILASCGSLDSTRKLESSQAVKLLPASADDSNRKHILGPASSQNRERRKVLLVEQPGQKMAGRSQQASKVTSSSHSRPVSVDDIKKAKMRQLYMQNKYGKSGFMSNESNEIKTEGSLKPSITRTGNLPSTKVNVRADVEEQKNVVPSKVPHKIDTSFPKTKLDPRETVLENCKRVQISWKIPAEVKLSDVWRVGGGEESKEIEIQKNRIRRERETVYRTVQEMPPNPKEPWDEEMDYDDSLTPVISIEQLPDTDIIPEPQPNGVVGSAAESASSSSHNPGAAEPDLELLAVLLKNPDLVLALTSGGARSLSSEDTVRLLDMIKAGGGAANLIAGNLNGGVSTSSSSSAGGRREERVEVSLPSPTPSVDPGTGSWAADGTRNPFSRHASTSAASYNRSAAYQVANPSTVALSATTVLPSPTPSRYPAAVPQHARNMQVSLSQSVQSTSMAPSFHNRIPTNSAAIPSQVPEVFNSLENNVSNLHPYRLSAAVASEMPVNSHSLSVPLQQQQQAQPIQLSQQPSYPGVSRSVSMGKQSSSNMSSLWRGGSSQPHQYNHSHSHSQPNQTNFNVSSRAHWDRNNYASNESETWSPGNSPKGYAVGRNILEPRVAPGRTREAESSRHGNSSGYWEQGRHGGRWQRDHRY